MIPVFERAKTVHALDRAAIVIGFAFICIQKKAEEEEDSIKDGKFRFECGPWSINSVT
jgi:hypothetical protein